MSTDKATPRPWRLDEAFPWEFNIVEDDGTKRGRYVLSIPRLSGTGALDLGKKIVRAVNAHDALVEALQKIVERIEFIAANWMGSIKCNEIPLEVELGSAKAALALARGENIPESEETAK